MKKWILAARLKTLPLAVSGALLGGSWALIYVHFNIAIFFLILIVAVCLQIISNYANDLGDYTKGTDKLAARKDRMLTTGDISIQQMKFALIVLIVITLILGTLLLYLSFGRLSLSFLLLFILGIAAIGAALKYTLGKSSFAYTGLGDFVVFVFFGLVAVMGAQFLYGSKINLFIALSAAGLGFLCMAVLNVNNLRDIGTDTLNNKKTLPVRIGKKAALRYHVLLITVGSLSIISAIVSAVFNEVEKLNWNEIGMTFVVFLPSLVLLIQHTHQTITAATFQDYNTQLKKLSLSILLLCFTAFFLAFLNKYIDNFSDL